MAALSDAVADPNALTLRLREWPDVQLVQMRFRGAGACDVTPIAFHAVSTFTGSSSYLSEESDNYRHPLRLPADSTLIRNAGTGARYAWTEPHEASMTCLDPALVRRAAAEIGLAHPDRVEVERSFDERDLVCEHLVRALEAEANLEPHDAQPFVIQSIASALAVRLLARYTTLGARPRRVPGGLDPRALRRVRAYIEENVGAAISLEDLASVAGVSRFHFARQFRASTGESPMGYLLRSRIERGKVRLRERDVSVSRI